MNNHQKIALRLGLLILIGSLMGFTPSSNSVTQKVQEVQQAFEGKNYQEGALNLVALAEMNPWWKVLWESAGDAAFKAGDYQLAKNSYEKSLELKALSFDGQINLGKTYVQLDEQEAAAAIWQDLEGSSIALEQLVVLYEDQGEITKAVETWHRYLTQSDEGSTPELILHFGLLMAADAPPKALPYLDQSSENFPEAGQVAAAIRITVNEEPAYQYVTAGQALAAINRWHLAAYAFEKAAILRRDYAEAWVYWGEALQHLENPSEDPLEILETGLSLDEDSPLTHLFLGLYWQRIGSHRTALDHFQIVEILWPENPDVLMEEGKSLAALSDLESAISKYQAAVELAPLDGNYYNQLAEFCVNYSFQVKEVGLPAARVAVQLDSGDPISLDMLGQVLLALDDEMNAVKHFQKALEMDPGYALAYYHLGILYSARNEPDLTIYYLQQTLAHTDNLALLDQAKRLLSNYQ